MQNQDIKISPHFWLRRFHSLAGVFPIGAFLLEHMFSNAYILRGPKAYNDQIAFLTGMPFVLFLEVFFIYLPILYHALYGFFVWFSGKSNLGPYPYRANWLYFLQRWTGAVTFVYILYHVYHTRITAALYGTEVSYARMQELLHHPGVMIFYLIGMAAVMFHFANGLWGFLISWGITIGRKARNFSAAACAVLGAALYVLGVQIVIHLIR